MASIKVRSLRDDLPFGSRISGINWDTVKNPAIRGQINNLFEERGVLVFEDVEPTSKMQMEVSTIFGPLKDHPVKTVERVDQNAMPGVIVINTDARKVPIVEVDGEQRIAYQPYHFDHSYNNELNRGGVLRSVITPPEGGLTYFADGIQLYQEISPELRKKIEGKNVIYTLDLRYGQMRFGKPKGFREVQVPQDQTILEVARALPRAIHPAVWTRKTGEKVLHISGYGARGIEGMENPEGDALLDAVLQEVRAKVQPYVHKWKPTDLVAWDNWRVLHEAQGVNPKYERCVHRTTIKGDYGLGYWENHVPGPNAAPAEMM